MKMLGRSLLCACAFALAAGGGAAAQPNRGGQDSNQEAARQRQQAGRNLPVREIERRIVPTMPGWDYLGFDFDPQTDIYRLKFLRKKEMIWIDIDGRTGRIVRRTG
ncbi:hypothetical protein ACFQ1E_00535 [Sphingomonas canadensis]|uniref:PepSY domain-containing protein n=2 Tax=Sphingomonas canadensis TaxID=1219257 RepID=A0ABW3H021_9SPHN|nr:hypothetical protein [Sphingomonas canadensis]